MRVPAILSAAVLVLAACGPKADAPPADGTMTSATTTTTTSTTTVTAAAGPTIQMVESKFEPVTLTIKVGDVVHFKNVSGGMHNVQFYADSIPKGAAAALDAGIADKGASLTSNMSNAGDEIVISFKDAPVGEYKFFCQPHQGAAMKGTIIVQ